MFIGNPATLDRVLAYLNGFEMALSMAHGHQLQLNEFSDLFKELHMLRNDAAEGITDFEVIRVLEPIMAKLYSVETGAIVSKEQTAVSATKRVDATGAEMLRVATREYRSEEQVDWDRESSRVSSLAHSLLTMIRRTSAES